MGRYDEAGPILAEGLSILKKALGPDHQRVADALFTLARFEWAQQHAEAAEAYFDQSQGIYSRVFAEQFAYMTENDRLAFLDKVSGLFPTFLSFGYAYGNQRPELVGKMYDAVLWEKGMVASSVTAQRAALLASRDSQSLALLDELTSKKNQLAALFRAPPADREHWRKAVDRLQRETADLEEEVTRRSTAFAEQKQLERTQWQQVRGALKTDEAAVEFVRFRFRDRAAWTKKCYYAALVVRPRGATAKVAVDAPILVPLGDAEDLEGAPMDDYRQRVARGPAPAPDTGVAFYRAFWKPLEPVLNGLARVYISPDGVLNQVSWAAIPMDDGRPLVEKYDIDVVLSTKDLLRQEHPSTNRRVVLIGNPAFDLSEPEQRAAVGAFRGTGEAQTLIAGLAKPPLSAEQPAVTAPDNALGSIDRGQRSRDAQSRTLDPLAGTQKEIESVAGLLKDQGWQVETYSQQNALEEVIKALKNPKVLHVATHGFFEPDQVSEPGEQPVRRALWPRRSDAAVGSLLCGGEPYVGGAGSARLRGRRDDCL